MFNKYCIYFNINCAYAIWLTDIFILDLLILHRSTCSLTISGSHLQWSTFFKAAVFQLQTFVVIFFHGIDLILPHQVQPYIHWMTLFLLKKSSCNNAFFIIYSFFFSKTDGSARIYSHQLWHCLCWRHIFIDSLSFDDINCSHSFFYGTVIILKNCHYLEQSIISSGLSFEKQIWENQLQFCFFKWACLFHRTSCSNFCLKGALLNAEKQLQPSIVNFTSA